MVITELWYVSLLSSLEDVNNQHLKLKESSKAATSLREAYKLLTLPVKVPPTLSPYFVVVCLCG